jgi:hypothetical protein
MAPPDKAVISGSTKVVSPEITLGRTPPLQIDARKNFLKKRR